MGRALRTTIKAARGCTRGRGGRASRHLSLCHSHAGIDVKWSRRLRQTAMTTDRGRGWDLRRSALRRPVCGPTHRPRCDGQLPCDEGSDGLWRCLNDLTDLDPIGTSTSYPGEEATRSHDRNLETGKKRAIGIKVLAMNSPDRNAKMERRRLFHGLCPRCGVPWTGPTRECPLCLARRSKRSRKRSDKGSTASTPAPRKGKRRE